jgi:hypothetical protein
MDISSLTDIRPLKRLLSEEEYWGRECEKKRRKLNEPYYELAREGLCDYWHFSHRLDDIQWERLNRCYQPYGGMGYTDNGNNRWVFLNKETKTFHMPNHGSSHSYGVFDDGFCKRAGFKYE